MHEESIAGLRAAHEPVNARKNVVVGRVFVVTVVHERLVRDSTRLVACHTMCFRQGEIMSMHERRMRCPQHEAWYRGRRILPGGTPVREIRGMQNNRKSRAQAALPSWQHCAPLA